MTFAYSNNLFFWKCLMLTNILILCVTLLISCVRFLVITCAKIEVLTWYIILYSCFINKANKKVNKHCIDYSDP